MNRCPADKSTEGAALTPTKIKHKGTGEEENGPTIDAAAADHVVLEQGEEEEEEEGEQMRALTLICGRNKKESL